MPARELTTLDEFHCRLHWALLRDQDDRRDGRRPGVAPYVLRIHASALWPSDTTTR